MQECPRLFSPCYNQKITVCDKGSAVQAHSRDRSFGVQLSFALVVEFCGRQVLEGKKSLLLIMFLNGLYKFLVEGC